MDVLIKPLSPDLLKDFLVFFDHMTFTENPHWSMCYCYSFHFTGTNEEWNKEDNRSAVIKLINDNMMRGYLAYSGGNPIGWCNVNERLNYQRLLKYYELIDNPGEKVCSIVCFLIHPDHRKKGIAQKILERICLDYVAKDYDFLEAYPGKGKLSSERHYMGPLSLYENNDFSIAGDYENYYVVRKKLK
jgi:GNAT superfamily N-acetyltransferase